MTSIVGAQYPLRFSGPEYEPDRDRVRLAGQILRIWRAMQGEEWRTLAEIESETGDPQASISAQLRHLRKARFGGHTVDRRQRGDGGTFEYQLVVAEGVGVDGLGKD